jgi:hypothetical protein
MPRQTHPAALHRQLVLDGSVPQHRRIFSLNWLGDSASLRLLKKVFQAPQSPGRLKALALEMYTKKAIELYLARTERLAQSSTPEGTK